MITYIIKRIASGESTFGVMMDDRNIPFAVTLELAWKDNQHNVSCIPPGTYITKRVVTPKHGECFQVMNVQDRDGILLHKANTIKDLLGCIGVGEKFDPVNGMDGIAESTLGYDEFMRKLQGVDSFSLRIIDCTDA
jgi:hypothetical protein